MTKKSKQEQIKSELLESDVQLVRLIEDLIEVLISKGVLNYTDLPHAAMQKLFQRQKLREQLNSISPLASTEE